MAKSTSLGALVFTLQAALLGCGDGDLGREIYSYRSSHSGVSENTLNFRSTQANVFLVTDFGASLNDEIADDAAFSACLTAAIQAGGTCKIGAGQLTLSHYPAPIRRASPAATNLDANNVVIEGIGSSTLIKGVSDAGFDVFQLNQVSHLTIRNLAITAVKQTSSQHHGVNGISMTNGSSHIMIEHVIVKNLPYVVKPAYIDGGKAFTIQQGSAGTESSTAIEVRNSQSINNPTGFGLDADSNGRILPGQVSFHDSTVTHAMFGVSLSFTAKNGGGTDVPGFSASILQNTFTNVKHPGVISRAPNVVFSNNTMSIASFPSYPDHFVYSKYAIAIIGGSACVFSGNSLTSSLPFAALVLTGGAATAANTEGMKFERNSLFGPATYGIAGVTQAGASTIKSTFSYNKFKQVLTTFDPALSAAKQNNQIWGTSRVQ